MSAGWIRGLSALTAKSAFVVVLIGATPAQAQEWEWALAPYFWGSGNLLDVEVKDDEVLEADLDFDDLLDKLDMALQVHFEGRRGRAGFFVDLTYLGTSDSFTTQPRPPLPGGTSVESDFETLMVEGVGFYRLTGDQVGLDLILGVRVTDFEMNLDIALPPPSTLTTDVDRSDTFTDGFVGLRHTSMLGQRWSLILRGDVGAGDSDLVWNVSGLLGLHFGEDNRFAVLGGYRHMVTEFEEGNVTVELTMSGPALGFLMRF